MTGSPIAIVGLASLLPGSDDLSGFWRSLIEARDCFSDVPEQYWRIDDYYDPEPRAKDKTYGRRGGFIPPQPFDALGFGLPPSTLPSTDVAQLLALLIAKRCLADADHGPEPRFDRKRTSVILGAAATTALVAHMSGRMARPMWREGLRRLGMDEAQIERACDAIADQFVPWQESTFPGLLGNVIAGRVANRFDLGGTNCALDAACASSLAALAMALSELRSGQADTVLTGGVDALNDVLMFLCFSQTPALSLSGDCRPFSDQADGTMLGEGVAMLALRRLEDAERDGHKIYAVIRGIGSSSDGRAKSVYAPRSEGQALALRRAYEDAGYSPATVGLMEAHGTGTIAGDAAEFAALAEVFGAAAPDRREWCALGSVKSQIGHTKAAAGAASLVKAVLALQHATLPPTIKVERPNPALKLDESPFYLNTSARPWFRPAEHPRRASVSSFGFGGSNFHVTLEEYTGPHTAPRLDVSPVQVVLLSADTPAALGEALAALPARIESPAQLVAVARESQSTFDAGAAARLALLVDSPASVVEATAEAQALIAAREPHARSARAILGLGPAARADSVAFLFPGQGSQYVGMGRDLALAFPDAFAAWERAAATLSGTAQAELDDLVFPRPAFSREALQAADTRLRATSVAQPALAAASLAQLALLGRVGLEPAAVAGHSFGELAALHAAGAFDADALVRLARARGSAMEACAAAGSESHTLGSMVAVAGDAETVRRLVADEADPRLVLANDNHPQQAVLSGPIDSLKRIEARLERAGLSYQELTVAAAFHSPLVAPAASTFAADVHATDVCTPHIPVVANATAEPYPATPDAVKSQLANQLAQPVRFRESVDALYARGCRIFVEVGAGNVLTGLLSKCLASRPHVALALDIPGRHGLRTWWQAIAELSVLGVPLRLEALHDAYGLPHTVASPAGPAVVQVGGANLGKPYPPPRSQGTRAPVTKASAGVAASSPSATAAAPEAPAVAARTVPSPLPSRDRHPMSEYVPTLHAQILEAQRLTQQALLESFSLTLRGLGSSAADVSAAALHAAQPVPVALPARAVGSIVPMPATPAIAAPAPPSVVSAPPPPVPAAVVPLPVPAPALPVAPVPAAASAPSVAEAPASSATPSTTVLAIIAEKTGYPVEALGPEMDLEADLGIDSIKRVEILGAVNDKVPGLDASRISPADVRRVSDLLALLGGSPADPQQAAAR